MCCNHMETMAMEENCRKEIVQYGREKNPHQNQENEFVLCKGDMRQLCCSKVIPYIKRNIGNNENTFLEE